MVKCHKRQRDNVSPLTNLNTGQIVLFYKIFKYRFESHLCYKLVNVIYVLIFFEIGFSLYNYIILKIDTYGRAYELVMQGLSVFGLYQRDVAMLHLKITVTLVQGEF